MSAGSETGRSFEALTTDLAAAGFRLDWMDEGPVRGVPLFAAFAHPDGRRIRFSHDLLTGQNRLEEAPAPAQPEAAAFSALPVETRRQALRWWMAHRTALTANVEAVLRAALNDADPETRVTAMLCALRLRAFALAEAVRAAEIPETTAEGAFPGDRVLYRRLQQLAVEALSGGGGDRASTLFGLLASPVERPEALLMHALCTPLPNVEAPEGELPDGAIVEDATLRLRGLGSELVWVPDVPHWRGGLRPVDRDDPRPRQEAPPTLLLVTKHVLSAAELSTLGVDAGEDGLIGADDLSTLAAGVARIVGPDVRPPDSAAWSMALHGPDGRLFPWGNSLGRAQRSGPWGAYWTEAPEWIVSGGKPELRTFERRPPTARGAIRLVVTGSA